MPDENKNQPPASVKEYPPDVLYVESLDIEAQGIAHRADGKVVFIVTTMRADETIRVISLRRASQDERDVFAQVSGYVQLGGA